MIIAAPHVPTLTSALDVLSAMITPAVLILACGSLIMTTSSRLIRCVDRVREFLPQMEAVAAMPESEATEERRTMLFEQLEKATARARLLQRSLSRLYAGLSMFVATSVSIGVIALLDVRWAWIALVLGFIGAGLLFSASIMLIVESRIALAATYGEMDYISRIGRQHAERVVDAADSRGE